MRKWKRVRAYGRFMAAAFSANFQAVVEYRSAFLLQVFGMMLNNGAFALFWAALIARTGDIGGYLFPDIMFVWALVSSAFGLAHVLLGNVRKLGQIIIDGELDVYLLQPKDPFLNVLASRTVVSAWGDLLYGYIVLFFLPDCCVSRFFLFTLCTLSGALIFAAVFAAGQSLSFFLGNAQALSSALSEFMLSFSLYPEAVFSPGMRWLFYSVLPTGFIAFVPLSIFKRLDWALLPALFAIAILYAAASYGLFRAGLKRYESGNRMGTRL